MERCSVEVLRIISRYQDQIKAQMLFERYCTEAGVKPESFPIDHIARFTLFLAKRRHDFGNIPDAYFQNMLNELVRLSNLTEAGNAVPVRARDN